MEAMQFNAKECHTNAGSMTVDIELVEVDRRESCLLDRSCCRSRSSGRDVVVMVVDFESVFDGVNGKGRR